MEILILLIPMSVVIALIIGAVFWWSADNGQFDDLESPGKRILIDDDAAPGTGDAATTDSKSEK